jgi:HSP20 family protein
MADRQEKWPMLRSFFNFPFLEEEPWELEARQQSGLSVSEDQNHVYVEAHLPGLNPDQIEVTFDKGILWVRGEKKEEEEDKKKKFYRKASSSFSYRVHIPGGIDEKKEPEATYKDGVMKVTFAKSSQNQAKKIQVKTKP